MFHIVKCRSRQARSFAVAAHFVAVAALLAALGRDAALGWQLPAEADGADCEPAPTCAGDCLVGSRNDPGCPKAGPAGAQFQLRCITTQFGTGTVYGTKCQQNNNANLDCNPFASTDTNQSKCISGQVWLCPCMTDAGQGGQSHPVCNYAGCPCMGLNNGGTGTFAGNNSCT